MLVPDGDRLWIDAPKAVVTPALRRSLADHKAELLLLLCPDDGQLTTRQPTVVITPDDLPGDWRVEFEERAAIRYKPAPRVLPDRLTAGQQTLNP